MKALYLLTKKPFTKYFFVPETFGHLWVVWPRSVSKCETEGCHFLSGLQFTWKIKILKSQTLTTFQIKHKLSHGIHGITYGWLWLICMKDVRKYIIHGCYVYDTHVLSQEVSNPPSKFEAPLADLVKHPKILWRSLLSCDIQLLANCCVKTPLLQKTWRRTREIYSMNIPQLCFDHPQLHSNLSIPPLPSDEALGGAVGSLRILDTCQKKAGAERSS